MLGHPPYPENVAERALRTWVRDDRLVGLPRKRSQRLPLLDLVAQDFVPGETYGYAEVLERLGRWYADTAALGRHLVDEGFLDRLPDGSRWWRSGGTVDLEEPASSGARRSSVRGGR